MHCVVNELGKGMLHTANTLGILRCFQFSQCGTGNTGEVGGICDWAGSAPHRVLSLRKGTAVWGGPVGTPQPGCAWHRHCPQSRAVLCKQTLQVSELLMSGTELLVTHTASCSLTWHGTDSSGGAILLSAELSQAPSAALEELHSVKMQCRTQIPEDAIGTY